MGFFDSIKGVGRALGGLLQTGIETFGPTLAQAGVIALERKLRLGPPPRSIPPILARRIPVRSAMAPLPPATMLPSRILPFSPAPLGPIPGGSLMPAFPVTRAAFDVGTSGGGFFGELTERLGGAIGGQTTFFRQGGPVARAVPLIMVPNPVTGAPTFFKHAGRPILFSGDLIACKRVARLASRARRVSRKR